MTIKPLVPIIRVGYIDFGKNRIEVDDLILSFYFMLKPNIKGTGGTCKFIKAYAHIVKLDSDSI